MQMQVPEQAQPGPPQKGFVPPTSGLQRAPTGGFQQDVYPQTVNIQQTGNTIGAAGRPLPADGRQDKGIDRNDVEDDDDFDESEVYSDSQEEISEEWPGRKTPHTVRRKCTDVWCLIPFFISCSGLIYLFVFGVPGAFPPRLKSYMDFQRDLCGYGPNEGKNVLYFCMGEDGKTPDLAHGICREACPTNSSNSYPCPREVPGSDELVNVMVPDYPSLPFSGGLGCQPRDLTMAASVVNSSSKEQNEWDTTFLWHRMLRSAWEPLAAVVVAQVILSYVFLFLMRYFARTLIWTSMFLLSVVPLGWGGCAIWCSQYGPNLGCTIIGETQDQSIHYKFMFGTAAIVLGALFTLIVCRQGNKVDLAISCLEWSFTLILSTPSLLLHPILLLIIRSLVLLVLYPTWREIMSLFFEDVDTLALTCTESGHCSFDSMAVALLVYFLFITYWILQITAGMSFMVVIHATQYWYFSGGLRQEVRTSRLLALRGFFITLRYHFGSVVMGGLVCGVFQPFRHLFGSLTWLARMDENPVGRVIGACCCCLVALYQNWLEPLSRNAYFEVVRSSRSFSDAALTVWDVMEDDDTIHLLNGATVIFQAVGLGLAFLCGSLLSQAIVKSGLPWKQFDEIGSPSYVFNPLVEDMAGGLIAVFLVFPFLMLFDIVSDTVLYCHIVEGHWKSQDHARDVRNQTWSDGIHSYFTDLAGCTCSWRSYKHPPPPGLPVASPTSNSERARRAEEQALLSNKSGGKARGGVRSPSKGGR